jgi:hypothetical protein
MDIETIDNKIQELETILAQQNTLYNNLNHEIRLLEIEAQNKREDAYQIINCEICPLKDKIRGLEVLKASLI